jgi:hypothetical protein
MESSSAALLSILRQGSGAFADDSNDQLVQAMAGFDSGGGAADGLNVAQFGVDTSQQTFLTTPQHA